jgi:Spy/CpxP family protein refolding chaperone
MREPRNKFLIAFALLALVALLAGPALARAFQDEADAAGVVGVPHDHSMMLQHVAKKLNLTAEQQASAKQLFADLKAKMAPIHQAQQQLHTQLEAALAAPSPDAATVGQLVISMHQGRAQLKPTMDAFHQQFEALLNPDQLAQYKQMLAAHSSSSFHRHSAGCPNPTQ